MAKKTKGIKSLDTLIKEATRSVETELNLEDKGWINFSASTGDVISSAERIANVKLSRLYAVKDPLGKQAIRLWTDYTFGSGMAWDTEDKEAKRVLESFWDARANRKILGAAGQRKSSDKVLTDGMVYFAIFLGAEGETKIRRIDPLEIKEIITNPDDKEDERYYRREWSNTQGKPQKAIYRSTDNKADIPTNDAAGNSVTSTEEALVYRFEYNDGNPLLLPALSWIKEYRHFLASRIAIMLALARFAWRSKVKGGQTAVDAIKTKTNDQEIAAASHLVENMGVDTTPIKTETGAQQAYQDARLIRLQICAAVGIPEQYFGDISTGNLATAKTVELPLQKMFESYQKVWSDAYKDINDVVLEHNDIPADKRYVDMDFPAIAPTDVVATATAIVQILQVMPEFAYSPDVQQVALMTLGINDPAEVLDELAKEAKKNPNIELSKVLKLFRESLEKKEEA